MHGLRAPIALLLLSFGAGAIGAFTLEPISTSIAPSGSGTIATFRIKSQDTTRIAIRFRVTTRDLSPDGKEINGSADDLFMIYPSRVLVEPGAQAVVKIQWRGPAKIGSEQCFRFIAEQVALDTGPTSGSSIKMMFRYIASIYVTLPSFGPELVASATGALGPDGSLGYLIEVKNEGTKHVVALDPSIKIGGGLLTLPPDKLGPLSGANYLPGRSISFFVAKADAVTGQHLEATIDYEGAY